MLQSLWNSVHHATGPLTLGPTFRSSLCTYIMPKLDKNPGKVFKIRFDGVWETLHIRQGECGNILAGVAQVVVWGSVYQTLV